VKRRAFIAGLGSAAAWPLAASPQPVNRIQRIGVLLPLPPAIMAGFFDELRQLGFVEGQNLFVDRRGFSARYDQFPVIAAELVNSKVDVILCGGDAAIRAAQQATQTIPILAVADDMVGAGLVESLARPGGNTSGISILAGDLDGKRQEVLLDLVPNIRRLAALADGQTTTARQFEVLRDAARVRGVELSIHTVDRPENIVPAIDAAREAGAEALNVLASALLHENSRIIIERTVALRMPTVYQWVDIAEQGGLVAYGPHFSEIFRQWARQLVKVFAGIKPADLPVEQPTKFELAINLKAAAGIGLKVPPAFLARADEVIE
jgi:putative tryptophan/tyrosine transport system substrate-binding protein